MAASCDSGAGVGYLRRDSDDDGVSESKLSQEERLSMARAKAMALTASRASATGPIGSSSVTIGAGVGAGAGGAATCTPRASGPSAPRASFFSRMGSARAEAAVEVDPGLAEELVKGLAHMESKFEDDERDLAFALELEAEESARCKAERAELEKLARMDAEAAQKLAEEERILSERRNQQEQSDMDMARRLQKTEVSSVSEQAAELMREWENPAFVATNKDGGIIVQGTLHHVGEIKVTLDEDQQMIVVRASPDFSSICDIANKLPKEFSLLPFDMHLDLKIVGKSVIGLGDVTTNYDKEANNLQVFVKNAYIKPEKKASFLAKLSSGVKRLLPRKAKSAAPSIPSGARAAPTL